MHFHRNQLSEKSRPGKSPGSLPRPKSSPSPSPTDFPSLYHVKFSALMLLQVLYFSESLVPTARKALCDPLEEVREAAAKTFEQLHSTIGHQALEDILPFLLKQLVSGSASPLPGGVPLSPWRLHAGADFAKAASAGPRGGGYIEWH